MTRNATLLAVTLALAACRGGDGTGDPLSFPEASDPDAFGLFLNRAPAVAADGSAVAGIDNVADFPEAYYNTIDPDGERDSFAKWREANGFTVGGQPAPCPAATCLEVRARFRDTKDLGYGRDMTMRRDLVTGDVAVYVENYQVDAIEGLPYGPLNAEALAEGDRSWNFGVNAIEFSSAANIDGDTRPFTKFYNFAGDGKRAIETAGSLQHAVDLDSRGRKNMPTPCIVCHGGLGRTLVVRDEASGRLRLAPTLEGLPAGDVMANLQALEPSTFQFVDAPGFRREDNEAAIAAINDAVLDTWRTRRAALSGNSAAWDPAFAIELLENRYPEREGAGETTRLAGTFDGSYVPDGWASDAPELYRDIVGPNCMVCHAMRGAELNPSLNLADFGRFRDYAERSDHLVFSRGVMPLGLLNYANLWDDPAKDTAALAGALGHPERVAADGRVPAPGAPVARIAAPTVASGIAADGGPLDIPLSARDSAFVDLSSLVWSVSPSSATIVPDAAGSGRARLRASAPGPYRITLEARGSERDELSRDTLTVSVVAAGAGAPPPAAQERFFGAGGVHEFLETNCTSCHVRENAFGYEAMPVFYERCRGDGGDDFLYRSVLARVNFDKPLDSLLLRKPSNGATDLADLVNSQIDGGDRGVATERYHTGGYVIGGDENYGRILSWILEGAPRGEPATPVPADAPACIG